MRTGSGKRSDEGDGFLSEETVEVGGLKSGSQSRVKSTVKEPTVVAGGVGGVGGR